jgi:hypothetical protein
MTVRSNKEQKSRRWIGNSKKFQINTITATKEDNMFLTIGLIIGFAAGWYVNEKFEDLAEASSKLKFWKK